jgi:ubiquinone/menaquinone biosynthesis C-methylase UbiE
VIISNCVINLSANKDQVLREAFRVLRPGGRLAVSDIVIRGSVPAELRQDPGLWAGCFTGALAESGYRAKLQVAGFTGIEVQPTRVYGEEEARDFLVCQTVEAARLAPQVADKFINAFVRAAKP